MGIFSENCDPYWAVGMPVMPLRQGEKRPFLPGWNNWQGQMPSEPEREAWRRMHPDGNLGLVLGPQSRMFALDVDTDDKGVLGLIKQIAPKSPWQRVGKKGVVLAYRYTDQPIVRVRYRIKEGENAGKITTLIDMLGAGSQVVLPPSIHPDTQKPYVANCHLYDVIDQLPVLPQAFEALLRQGLLDLGWDLVGGVKDAQGIHSVTNFISVGNRDSALVGFAGAFARDVMKGSRTLRQAMAQMSIEVNHFMEKTYGDNVSEDKGHAKMIEFIKRDMSGPMGKPLPTGWDDDLTGIELDKMGLGEADLGEDDEVWEPQDIRDWFLGEVSKTGAKEDPEIFLGVAKTCIMRIARNPAMDPIEQESLLKYIVDLSGKQVSLSGVRKQLNRMRQGAIEGLSHGQIAEAAIVRVEEVGGEVRCWKEKLWQWRGSHWEEMDEKVIIKFVIQEYSELQAGRKNSDHSGIMRTIKSLRTADLCQRVGMSGVNFVNGFLDEDLVMWDHDPDFGMTYCLPYAYEPEKADKCWKFQQMLVNFWGEDSDYAAKVECLAECLALTFFEMMTQVQVAVCLYGVPNSGKSRIIALLEQLLPDEMVTSVPPTSWGERFSVVHLVGKLVNVAGELSEKYKIDGVRFKTVISGDTIDAEEKLQPKFTFKPTCAHWFSSNFLPKSDDSSEGFTRRWVFLVFNKRVPEELIVRDFEKAIVAEEREAIVAWALARMPGLRARNLRLTDPISSMEQRASLENELNSVRSFLHDFRENGRMLLGVEDYKNALVVSGAEEAAQAAAGSRARKLARDTAMSCFTPFDTLYHAYRSYCVAQAVSPVGSKVMMKRMELLQGTFGFKVDKLQNPAGLFIAAYKYLILVDPSKVKAVRAA